MFILDRSTSVKLKNHQLALKFIQNVVSSLNISLNGVHVGFVAYSSSSTKVFNLKRYTALDTLQYGISQVRYLRGSTNTPAGLRDAREILTSSNLGARQSPVPKIAVLLTGNLYDL